MVKPRMVRLSAEQGYALGQYNLGLKYEYGQVFQDLVLAHMWVNISSANGHQPASEQRTEIEV